MTNLREQLRRDVVATRNCHERAVGGRSRNRRRASLSGHGPATRALLRHPATREGVADVVARRTDEEVLAIYATRDIARMAYDEAIGNWPVRKLVGYAVRIEIPMLTIGRADAKLPVAAFRAAGRPQPAAVSALNFRPEPCYAFCVCQRPEGPTALTVSRVL